VKPGGDRRRQSMVGYIAVERGECEATVRLKQKSSAAGFAGLGRLSGGRPAIHGVIQLSPFPIPAQLAQSVIRNPHSIIVR
jgi:hypothetical protein